MGALICISQPPPRRPFNFQKPSRKDVHGGFCGGTGARTRAGTKPNRTIEYKATTRAERASQFSRWKKVRTWSYSPARIKLTSDSRKLARAARSADQGMAGISRTSLFCKCRFKNSKAEDFWREDFLEGNANTIQIQGVLAPPTRARTSPFAGGSETSEASSKGLQSKI